MSGLYRHLAQHLEIRPRIFRNPIDKHQNINYETAFGKICMIKKCNQRKELRCKNVQDYKRSHRKSDLMF
jgi:hypothetical protein